MNQKAQWVAGCSGLLLGLGLQLLMGVAETKGGSVTLAWNASPGTNLSYRLYFGGASHAYTNHLETGTNVTATVSGLLNGATYYFAATCYTPDGTESDYSNEVAYRVAPQPPVLQPNQVLLEVPVTFWSSTNLGLPNWQVLGGASAWLVVPATNPQQFFSATSSVVPGGQLGLTITRSTNR